MYRSCKLRILGFQRSDLGGRNLAEVGDDGGINGVGLGQVVHGFGEVVYLAGIYDNGGNPSVSKARRLLFGKDRSI